MKRCWTGIRASDALYTGGYFDYVATLFGAPGSLGKRVDHNKPSNDEIVGETIDTQVCGLREFSPDLKVVAYNQSYIDLVRKHKKTDYIVLDSKTVFRKTLQDLGIPALEANEIPNDIEDIYRYIVDREGKGTFVVQCDHSSGGDGTYLLNEESATYINKNLRGRKGLWFYSRYREHSIPINVHVIISNDEVYLSPGSIQITKVCGCRILYRGADFIAYRALDPSVLQTVSEYAREVGKIIQDRGYRGVAGIDAVIDGHDILMVETNLRYQASTFLINKEIRDRVADGAGHWAVPGTRQQISMHMLGDAARDGRSLSGLVSQEEFEKLEVNYSFYTYIAEDGGHTGVEPYHGFHDENKAMGMQWRHVLRALTKSIGTDGSTDIVSEDWQHQSEAIGDVSIRMRSKRYTLISDGFDEGSETEPYSYLYKVVVNRRIVTGDFSAISGELEEPRWFISDFDMASPLKLKIALVNQGIRISPEASESLKSRAFAVNHSVDLQLESSGHKLWVNCPCSEYHALLSPFELSADGGRLFLTYYGDELLGINISCKKDPYPKGREFDRSRGFKENDICVITTDRLRIQHSSRCKFEKKGVPCTFCEVGLDSCPWVDRAKDPLSKFGIEDILKCLRGYLESNRDRLMFRHIMIGGKSCDDQERTEENVRRICEVIKQYGEYDVYLMCVPTSDLGRLQRYKEMGISRIGFNMDIINDGNSMVYAPGKRSENTFESYLESMEAAVSVFGKGKVYSAAVVGLERLEDYLRWIRALEDRGVVPVISAFRPVPLTKASITGPPPPSNELLLKLHNYACDYGRGKGGFEEGQIHFPDIAPGPFCNACQNNTVAVPWKGHSDGVKAN